MSQACIDSRLSPSAIENNIYTLVFLLNDPLYRKNLNVESIFYPFTDTETPEKEAELENRLKLCKK